MAMKTKYRLIQENGVLHIGGGRFFFPKNDYYLTQAEVGGFGHYFIKETVQEEKADESMQTLAPQQENADKPAPKEQKADEPAQAPAAKDQKKSAPAPANLDEIMKG